MARKIDLETKLQAAGYCCTFGWCSLTQQKEMRRHKRTKAITVAAKLDVHMQTIFNARRKYDNGKLMCQGMPNCQKALFASIEPVAMVFSYPARFVLAIEDQWLITFRDFPEIKEYCRPNLDHFVAAQLALEAAIDERIRRLRVVPFPSRAWEGDRMVEVPKGVSERMMDYRKFFLTKNVERESDY